MGGCAACSGRRRGRTSSRGRCARPWPASRTARPCTASSSRGARCAGASGGPPRTSSWPWTRRPWPRGAWRRCTGGRCALAWPPLACLRRSLSRQGPLSSPPSKLQPAPERTPFCSQEDLGSPPLTHACDSPLAVVLRECVGGRVRVQVRHPGVAVRIAQDFLIMGLAARLLDSVPFLAWLRVHETVRQFSHTMTAQVRAPMPMSPETKGCLAQLRT